MDLRKYFSDLEYNEQPDTFFIGHYGFTLAGIMEKLENLEEEKSVLNYLVNLRDKVIDITQELQSHSISRFDSTTKIDGNDPNNLILISNKPYSQTQKEYEEYLKSLQIDKIKNKVVKTIMEDITTDDRDVNVLSLTTEFSDLITWLDRFIRKVSVMNEIYLDEEISDNYKSDDKIVWMKKREDFIALFNKLFDLGFFAYKKNKYQVLAKHFAWPDDIMNPENLRHLKNNIVNKSETHQISDELKKLNFE